MLCFRFVCWHALVLRNVGKGTSPINSPHSRYYQQENTDEGVLMETDIPIADVSLIGQYPIWTNMFKLFNEIPTFTFINCNFCYKILSPLANLTQY